MTGWPDQPMIYEINTAVWLDELSRAAGRPVTLAGVGAADWDAAVPAGVDAVWPMGVWGRSPAGLGLANVRDHLRADLSYQSRLMLFLDNHDDPRIASCVPADAERAAAVAIATLPGATLWHEGQFEGRRVRPPVFLSRRPDEVPDLELGAWYRHLLAAVADHHLRAAAWRLLEAGGWPDNQSCANLAAWSWAGDRGSDRHVVVVNLSGQAAQARIPPDLPGRSWQLTDIVGQNVFERDGGELASPGLFVDLGPWQFHLFALQ